MSEQLKLPKVLEPWRQSIMTLIIDDCERHESRLMTLLDGMAMGWGFEFERYGDDYEEAKETIREKCPDLAARRRMFKVIREIQKLNLIAVEAYEVLSNESLPTYLQKS